MSEIEHEGKLCVRYFRRSDGTILTSDCDIGIDRRRKRRLIAAGAAALLAGGGGLVASMLKVDQGVFDKALEATRPK